MLVKHTPDRWDKLQLLGGMATDDHLAQPTDGRVGRMARGPYSAPKKNPVAGVYKASMPNGKTISLMRVMFTDFCKMDCYFCPNSHWVPRKRYAFKVDELAKTFHDLQSRQTVDGLFLSSGVAGTGSKTTEKLIKTVDVIRNKYGFQGYVHLKVMPGTEHQYVEAAHRLGTRLSINMETPTDDHMRKLSKMKDLERDILDPMRWIDDLIRKPTDGAVGQATQLVVGAADETDWDIFQRVDQLYGEWKLKRVYYAPFHPVKYTPLEEHPPTPMARSHRLYQVDWLKRIYNYDNDELKLAFAGDGLLPLEDDPKMAIALESLDRYPVDVNAATRADLLRVSGVGPTSTDRILSNRARHKIDSWRDLQAMGVVRKRAWAFLAFPGQRPPRAKQLKMDLTAREPSPLGDLVTRREGSAALGAAAAAPLPMATATGAAPCGEVRSCTGCPMFGAPGHPGSTGSPQFAPAALATIPAG